MTSLVVRLSPSRELLMWRNAGRMKLTEENRCRLCERLSSVRPLTRHHLVPKAWFQSRTFVLVTAYGTKPVARYLVRDVDANIVPLCAPCHATLEVHDEVRRMLRKRLASQEAAYAVSLRGQPWLDAIYPPRIGSDLELQLHEALKQEPRHRRSCSVRHGCIPGCRVAERLAAVG